MKKKCTTCKFFSHALDAMTDHVDYHSCDFFECRLDDVNKANSCKEYKRRGK